MNRSISVFLMGAFFACVLALAESHAAESQTAKPPNIVFLLADDLGGGDLGCYGHPYARTPNIDRLAKEGTQFTQFNSTGATCCPARTGLMTSKFTATFADYPANAGFADRVTITELLKRQGYVTGHFGKWHIGPVSTSGTYGIDVINGSDDQTQSGKKKLADDARGRDAHIYDDAITFIEENQDKPFYVNVWGHISHNKVDPHDELVKRWNGLKVDPSDFPSQMAVKFDSARKFGDVDDAMQRYLADVESLDDAVGRLLKRLDELGLRENTIVVFNSDQGAGMGEFNEGGTRLNMMGCNGPYRGGKHTFWEGGVRVPWIVCWPGHVPAGRTDKQSVLSGVDWLPTLCAITGIKINANEFDGEDTSAAWLGRAPHVRTKPLLWKTSNPGSEAYVRIGQWKLQHPTRKKHGPPQLYDIIADSAESNDVATQHPDVVKRLSAVVQSWNNTLPKQYSKTDDKQD